MSTRTLEQDILRSLRRVKADDIRDRLRQRADVQKIKALKGPQTKQEFWEWVRDRVGVELSRKSVCPGHHCQLDMAWELYSFAVTRVLWVVNRGGSKTSLASWTDVCQAEHFPGWSVFTIGATRSQGDRKYEYMLPLVVEGGVIGGKELDHVIRSIATETQFKNGSKCEIAQGSSAEQANGPRTPRLHRDEVEQMHDDTYKQAGNIPAGRKMRDGRYAPAQILDTSTMKFSGGRVDKAMQAYEEARVAGVRPAMEVRVSCVYESARENPFCRSADPERRQARLKELNLPEDQLCDCQTWVKDVIPSEDDVEDEDLEPRTLESVCQGRFFDSRGFKEFDDIQTLFLENDRETWNSEQECSQPSTEGAYIRSYNQTRNGIKGYRPDPENGLIYMSVDWGSGDEAWCGHFQVLDRDVQVKSYKGDGIRTMPAGAMVVFSEIYRAGMGNVELGKMVIEQEAQWIIEFPGWRVHERYYDNALLGAALDWRDQLGLQMTNRIRKDFVEELKLVRERVGQAGGLYVDILACPWFDKSIRGWRQVNGREIHNEWSHALAATRYLLHNLHVVERKLKKMGHRTGRPAAADTEGRTDERQKELRASQGSTNPLKTNGGLVVMIGAQTDPTQYEEFGDVGAEDSPRRAAERRMGGPDSFQAPFNRLPR